MDDLNDSKPNGKLAWVPFYIGDHLRATQGLSDAEVSAYFQLLCYFAEHGNLPADDARLARIAQRKSVHEWKKLRPALLPLFAPGSRIATEITKAHAIRENRIASGRKGGYAKAGRPTTSDSEPATSDKCQTGSTATILPGRLPGVLPVAKGYHTHSHPHPVTGKGSLQGSTPSFNGSASSVDGSATVQEEASTGTHVRMRANGCDGAWDGEAE